MARNMTVWLLLYGTMCFLNGGIAAEPGYSGLDWLSFLSVVGVPAGITYLVLRDIERA